MQMTGLREQKVPIGEPAQGELRSRTDPAAAVKAGRFPRELRPSLGG